MPRMIICKECGESVSHEAKGLCHRCYNRILYHINEAHREAVKERSRQYYREHTEVMKQKQREYSKARRHECVDCEAEIWQASTRCCSCATRVQWDAPDQVLRRAVQRNYGLCRRCNRRPAEAKDFCLQCYNHLRHRAGGRYGLSLVERECFYCGEGAEEWDHFVPVSAGGLASQGNMVPACKKCNMTKFTQLPQDYIEQLVFA